MTVERLKDVPGFSIDRVAAAAGADPDVLRLENLDTDLRPPKEALEVTRAAIDEDDANSYLPFIGSAELRQAVAGHVGRLSGIPYDADRQCVITAGGTEGLLNVLLATLNPGDEVLLTDPTYAGMICRVRLAGGVPRLVPFVFREGEWRLDLHALAEAISDRTRMVFLMNPSMPSGAVLNLGEWEAIAALCVRHSLWLLYNAAMERILYDGRPYLHPAGLPGMARAHHHRWLSVERIPHDRLASRMGHRASGHHARCCESRHVQRRDACRPGPKSSGGCVKGARQ